LKEQEIKRQFQDAAKIQQKQFKVYRTHQLAKTSKAEQKELMKRLKEEQLRRMAMLSQQYDASIAEMIERQNVSDAVFSSSFCNCIVMFINKFKSDCIEMTHIDITDLPLMHFQHFKNL